MLIPGLSRRAARVQGPIRRDNAGKTRPCAAPHTGRQPARSDGPPVRVQDINEGSHESRPASRAENGAEVTAPTDEHPAAHADAAPPPHGLGPLGLGLVRTIIQEPPPHAVAARPAERAVRLGVVRPVVAEPRAVGVAIGLADGLGRFQEHGGGRRAAAVVGPLGKSIVPRGGASFWIARVLGLHGRAARALGRGRGLAAAAAEVESGRG